MNRTRLLQGWRSNISRLLALLLLLAVSMSVAGTSVFASLDATAFNVAPQAVSTGTLVLVGTPVGSGFATAINSLAPGDVTNRYVSYQNSGTLDAQNLTLSLADSGSSVLTSDGTQGLQVVVTACNVAWTVASNVGTCSGATTVLLTTTSTLSLKTTPASLVSGALLAGSWQYLQFSIAFPTVTETTANGIAPVVTVQGLSASLTWTLRELQRDATTTNS